MHICTLYTSPCTCAFSFHFRFQAPKRKKKRMSCTETRVKTKVLLHNGGFCNGYMRTSVCDVRITQKKCHAMIMFHDCSVIEDKSKKKNLRVFWQFLSNVFLWSESCKYCSVMLCSLCKMLRRLIAAPNKEIIENYKNRVHRDNAQCTCLVQHVL